MWQHNGKVYARVSDIIKPFVDFKGIPDEVIERKASLGTRIHNAIQQDIEGDLIVVEAKGRGYFHSFEKWRDILSPVFIKTEMRCYCDDKMITGCIDAVVQLKGEEIPILVDWKTSAAESPITWPMQAHLYAYLLKKIGIEVAPRYLFVKLDRLGDLPKVFQYKFDSNLLKRCFQAIDSFWKNRNVAENVF